MVSRRLFCFSTAAWAAAGGSAAAPPPDVAAQRLKLSQPRATHNMVRTPDGAVLIIGGCVARGCAAATATVDRYDPGTRAISEIGRLAGPRIEGAAAALPDGSVLLAGGWIGEGRATASVERFDPASGRSERLGELSVAQACQAITLADRRVLLLGEHAVDVLDPGSRRVIALTKTSPYLEAGSATRLLDGRILTVGGGIYGRQPTAEAHILDPRTGRFERTGSLAAPRIKHAAVRLLDGKVLIVGGSDARGRDGGKTRSLELYDPATGRFSHVGETRDARFKIPEGAVRLLDGRVLVAGGADTPEIIDPRTWTSRSLDIPLGGVLNFTTAVVLTDGDVMVAGGYGERTIDPTDRAWIIPRAAMA